MRFITRLKRILPRRSNIVIHGRKSFIRRHLIPSLAFLVVFLGIVGTTGAFFVSRQMGAAPTYELVLEASNVQDGRYLMASKGEVRAKTKVTRSSAFSLSQSVQVIMKAKLDEVEIFSTTQEIGKNDQETALVTIPLDVSALASGEHRVMVTLTQETNGGVQTLDTEELLVVSDRVPPQLLSVNTDKGSLSRYVLTAEKSATDAAQNGIKIISNSKGPFAITWNFSESVVSPSSVASTSASLDFSQNQPATISATLTSKENLFTQPLVFRDTVGNELLTELQYVFDGTPPKINVNFDYRLHEENRHNFFFTFTASEPLAWARASTADGVTKTAVGTYKGYSISGMSLPAEKNLITITGQDLAGNQATAQLQATIMPKVTYNSLDEIFKSKLPANARHCTDEDKKICGYENVSDMSCEQFKVVKDCLKSRCSRDGFYLGSCEG